MKNNYFWRNHARLKSPGFERLFQSPVLKLHLEGEANVAVSWLIMEWMLLSLPVCRTMILAGTMHELRKFGVDVSLIQFGPGRMGIYFLESGANQRPSKVIYDRDSSSIALAEPGRFDWENFYRCRLVSY